MPTTTKGAPYPASNGPNNVPGDLQEIAEWVDARPGIAAMTNSERDALPADQKWPGRIIFNTTRQVHQTYRSDFDEWHEGLGAAPGDIKETLDANPPPGWVVRNGQALSRVTHAALFARIGTTYGAGNNVDTFNVPDDRDRFPIGASATRAAGSTGGTDAVDLVNAHLPSHGHNASSGSAGGHSHTGGTGSAGSHNHGGQATGVGPYQHRHPGSGFTGSYPSGQQINVAGVAVADGTEWGYTISPDGAHTHSVSPESGHTHAVTVNATAEGNTPVPIVPRYRAVLPLIKT